MGQEQQKAEEFGRVVKFERREPSVAAARPQPAPSPVEDVGKYERPADEPDDYRHRQLVNVFAFIVCALLVAGGIWLANKIADLRRDQDCVLSGRRNCAPISITGPGSR